MKDWRIEINHIRLDFTYENSRFKTNITKRNQNYPDDSCKGNVLSRPLYENGEVALFLKHVTCKDDTIEHFWFMWYKNGQPSLSGSAVFDRDDLTEIIDRIATIKIDNL